jgi:hypothetical protein
VALYRQCQTPPPPTHPRVIQQVSSFKFQDGSKDAAGLQFQVCRLPCKPYDEVMALLNSGVVKIAALN